MKERFRYLELFVQFATGWLSLWVRIRGKASKCQKHVCYGLSNEVRRWLKSLSNYRKSSDHSAASYRRAPSLISAERTTHRDESNQKRFLEYVSNNFLIQMVDEPTSGHSLLFLLLANEKEEVRGVIINSSLGCTHHEVVQDPLLLRKAGGRVQTLYFRRANISLFRE